VIGFDFYFHSKLGIIVSVSLSLSYSRYDIDDGGCDEGHPRWGNHPHVFRDIGFT